MQTYTILKYIDSLSTWKIRFLNYEIYSTAWITNAGLIHQWANTPEDIINHLNKVKKFHHLKLLTPVSQTLFNEIYEWIDSFLKGTPLCPPISIFSLKHFPMYKKIINIPFGQVAFYSEIAHTFPHRIQLIRALKFNPFPPLIPCHRIVPKDHFPGNYTPLGKNFKLDLLMFENSINETKVDHS